MKWNKKKVPKGFLTVKTHNQYYIIIIIIIIVVVILVFVV